jgi:hypothetical protein
MFAVVVVEEVGAFLGAAGSRLRKHGRRSK